MKRVAILGTWKSIQIDIIDDVRSFTRQVINDGNIVMTGGSAGADFYVAQECLKKDLKAERLEIVLPIPYEKYKSHVRKSGIMSAISKEEADKILSQLQLVRELNKTSLKAMKTLEFSNDALITRNAAVAAIADELIVFQINDSTDVEAALVQARKREIPVRIMHYYR